MRDLYPKYKELQLKNKKTTNKTDEEEKRNRKIQKA